ncbi:DUF927 domain-containing protein [Saccharibacillus sacchari]|uniref:DUF927 domain-containing protein n=1 Tax=Saccharibacillus sacchari TaxID=456493 RepID=UPI0004B130EA|nr:DUF927 domain-containing protein [Saccharibacillus sacchari]
MEQYVEKFVSENARITEYRATLEKAIHALNYGVASTTTENKIAYIEARRKIIKHVLSLYPDKTEEDVVADIVTHASVLPAAVSDYMLYHHPTFPGNKAALVPAHKKFSALGIHISQHIADGKEVGKRNHMSELTNKPYTEICFYNERKKYWMYFSVADTDIYTSSKKFSDACISNGLILLKNRRISEFDELSEYLKDYLDLNEHLIPTLTVHTSIGWTEDYSEFINPRSSAHVINVTDSKQKRSLDLGYVTLGTDVKKNVSGILNVLAKHPLSLIVYTAPFINVIIDGAVIPGNCLTVDIFGPKGKGKNLLQYTAMNPMGCSKEKSELMRSCARLTVAGMNSVVRFHNSHVVCYEESHRASTEVLEDALYNVFNSTLSDKATSEGTSRDDGRFSSIIVASGESSILSRVKNDGLTRRVIPLNVRDVFAGIFDDPAAMKNMHRELGAALNDSYGLALDAFLDYVIPNREDVAERFKVYLAKYENPAGKATVLFDNEKYKTFSSYTACMHLVLDLLVEILDLDVVTKEQVSELCNEVISYMTSLCAGKAKSVEALSDVYNFAVTNHEKHFTGNNKNHAQLGKFGTREIAGVECDVLFFTNAELKKYLNVAGYIADNIIDEWKELGVLNGQIVNRGNGKTKMLYVSSVMIGESRISCSVIRMSRVKELLTEEEVVEIEAERAKLINVVKIASRL